MAQLGALTYCSLHGLGTHPQRTGYLPSGPRWLRAPQRTALASSVIPPVPRVRETTGREAHYDPERLNHSATESGGRRIAASSVDSSRPKLEPQYLPFLYLTYSTVNCCGALGTGSLLPPLRQVGCFPKATYTFSQRPWSVVRRVGCTREKSTHPMPRDWHSPTGNHKL